MLKKSRLDGGLSEGFWFTAVIANSLVVEKSVKRSQNSPSQNSELRILNSEGLHISGEGV